MCRLKGAQHRRLGGQGAVVFARLAYNSETELAVKFFFDQAAFEKEAETAQIPVCARARASTALPLSQCCPPMLDLTAQLRTREPPLLSGQASDQAPSAEPAARCGSSCSP